MVCSRYAECFENFENKRRTLTIYLLNLILASVTGALRNERLEATGKNKVYVYTY